MNIFLKKIEAFTTMNFPHGRTIEDSARYTEQEKKPQGFHTKTVRSTLDLVNFQKRCLLEFKWIKEL